MSISKYDSIVIQGWMIEKLKLHSDRLLIYAIMYSGCQFSPQKGYELSLTNLCEWCGKSNTEIKKSIGELEIRGLIKGKEIVDEKGKSKVYYKVFTDDIKPLSLIEIPEKETNEIPKVPTIIIENSLPYATGISYNQTTEKEYSQVSANELKKNSKQIQIMKALFRTIDENMQEETYRNLLYSWVQGLYELSKPLSKQSLILEINYIKENIPYIKTYYNGEI